MTKQERKAEKAYRRVLRGLKAAGSSEEVRELARRVERAHLGASSAGAAACREVPLSVKRHGCGWKH